MVGVSKNKKWKQFNMTYQIKSQNHIRICNKSKIITILVNLKMERNTDNTY